MKRYAEGRDEHTAVLVQDAPVRACDLKEATKNVGGNGLAESGWSSVGPSCPPLDQGQKRVLAARVTVAMLPVPGGDGRQVDLDGWRGQLAQAEGRCEIGDSPLGSRECCDLI